MNFSDISNNVERAITQVQTMAQTIGELQVFIQDNNRRKEQLMSQAYALGNDEDSARRRNEIGRMISNINSENQRYSNMLQNAQTKYNEAANYLNVCKAKLGELEAAIVQRLKSLESSMEKLSIMSSGPFGGSAAANEMSRLDAKYNQHTAELNATKALIQRIDEAAASGDPDRPKVLRRR